jgi:hypothetical protein
MYVLKLNINQWKHLISKEYLQLTKILMVPPKCKTDFGALSNANFFNIANKILVFSLLLSL